MVDDLGIENRNSSFCEGLIAVYIDLRNAVAMELGNFVAACVVYFFTLKGKNKGNHNKN